VHVHTSASQFVLSLLTEADISQVYCIEEIIDHVKSSPIHLATKNTTRLARSHDLQFVHCLTAHQHYLGCKFVVVISSRPC